MLHLILGKAGTGKTTLLHERIAACVEQGARAILIVPEQYSFESEKSLYRRLGAHGAMSVEVLSFTRLCDRIFRELGGLAGAHLDDTAKYLLMCVTLGELGNGLAVYSKAVENAAFIAEMCSTVSELKMAGVTDEQLRRAAGNAENPALSGKLSDISLIFSTYQALIERGYQDPDDCLRRACKQLRGTRLFQDYHIFIDGFVAFMGAEWQMIQELVSGCAHVTVALTCAGLQDKNESGVLTAGTKTAKRFVALAKHAGVSVAAPVVCTQPVRFQNPALAFLAEAYPSPRPLRCDFEPDGVEIVRCEESYDEMEYVAAKISALVRDEGYRYNQIAVIGRSLERYLVPMQTVFSRYQIPYFADRREDIQVYPLVSGLLSALDAVVNHFDSDYLLALSKNCISGISPIESGLLENYCFIWNIQKSGWREEFVNNPDGMAEGFTDDQKERLAQINGIRRRLTEPLFRLERELHGCNGKRFATAVFHYLSENGVVEHLQEAAEAMPDTQAKQFLETGAQVWDILIDLIDVFGGVLGEVHLPLRRLVELFRMSVATADIGSLPQTLDQVIVGTADRIRPDKPRAVFVIGLNEGEFPLAYHAGGIFSAGERSYLRSQEIDLLQTPDQKALFEKYYAYFALTQASERLCLSFSERDMQGGALAPSGVVAQVEELLGELTRGSYALDEWERVGSGESAFHMLSRCWGQDRDLNGTLRRYFEVHAPGRVEALDIFAAGRTFHLDDTGTSLALFGQEMRISPSRVDRFYSCPFSYFCQVGLKLQPRRRAEFNPLESGTLVHLVLERVVRKYGGKGLIEIEEEALRNEIREIIEESLASKIQDFDKMPARFKYLFRRLQNTLLRLIRRLALEFAQCDFEPVAFELPIGKESQVQPLPLQTVDGTQVLVEGVVDRVDVMERDGKRFVRVVDYKSGRKTFNLSDIYYGLNMQMLIYLFTICEQPGRSDTIPAGVLYMPARDAVISAERGEGEKEIAQKQLKRLRMSGILIEDREVLSAMEPDLSGVFIPAKVKKDGSFDAHSSLASLSQMGIIKRQVEKLVVRIAEDLHRGKISACPVDGSPDYTPCKWCDYHAVCTHEDDEAVRKIALLDKAEALKRMEEEHTDG